MDITFHSDGTVSKGADHVAADRWLGPPDTVYPTMTLVSFGDIFALTIDGLSIPITADIFNQICDRFGMELGR